MAIEINADDVKNAETFLEAVLTEGIPQGRFTKGSALRDLTVQALAFAFAHFQKEVTLSRSLQSLLSIRNIATTDDPELDRTVSSATDAILSNWYIDRKMGVFARGLIFVEVSRRQDYVIPGSYRFDYDRDRVFFPDVPDPSQSIIIRAADLLPVMNADGSIARYQFSLRVIAAVTGATYNVAPATWQGGTTFSPYAVRIYNATTFDNGKNRETTAELIARSDTAITVRNLINQRSVEAVLRDKFPSLGTVLVVGMGEPEMQRDLRLGVHMGGHYDVYVHLPRTQTSVEGVVGGSFLRPDGRIHVFRDSAVADWTAQFLDRQNQYVSIQPGDVLRVASGLSEVPKDFVIREVLPAELRVGTNTPFSEATEEIQGRSVAYYIYRPLYGADYQLYPAVGLGETTGQTSRRVTTPHGVVLPGGGHYEIIDVAVINPDVGDLSANLATGFVHFPVRTNDAPSGFSYQVVAHEVQAAQSMHAFDEIRIAGYEGKTLRVTYETLAGLDTIHSFTRDRFERVQAADILVRGLHPVYLTFVLPYRLKPLATAGIDEQKFREALVQFVNGFDPHDVIDVSDLSAAAHGHSSNIGAVLPFTISYELLLPDGRRLSYQTASEVTLSADNLIAGQTNGAFAAPWSQGVSDRTVRYLTSLSRVTVALKD